MPSYPHHHMHLPRTVLMFDMNVSNLNSLNKVFQHWLYSKNIPITSYGMSFISFSLFHCDTSIKKKNISIISMKIFTVIEKQHSVEYLMILLKQYEIQNDLMVYHPKKPTITISFLI